jgi:hypothetical protein
MKRMGRPFKLLDNAYHERPRYTEPRHPQSPMKSFLSTVHLEGLYNVLKENQVAFQDLPLLTRDDLIDLEVPIGPRNRLLKAVKTIDKTRLTARLMSMRRV